MIHIALLSLSLLSPVPEEEGIRLRSGKIISGSVHLEESTKDGFIVRPWDSEGAVFVRWSQLTAAEIDRVTKRPAAAVRPAVDLIDGIRVHTISRTVVGVLVREDADRLSIKTGDSRTPVVVPKSALLSREDRVEIPETEAYSPAERVERRAAKLDPKDVQGAIDLAGLAARWGLFDKAKELYLRAAAAEPARSEEIQGLIGAGEALARERQAADVLGEIGRLARKAEYAKAIALATSLLAERGDTEAAKGNKDLVAELEKEAKEWTVRKAEVLARRVPDAYHEKLVEKLLQAARLSKIGEARTMAGGMDQEIVKELAAEMKSTVDEIRIAWSAREKKIRTGVYGAGSWIILGGRSGGLDTDAKFVPVHRNTAKPPPPPIPLGVKLDTPEDWWMKASKYDRLDWIEAEFARLTAGIVKTLRERRCARCVGAGEFSTSRMGIDCVVICPRCHGSKVDQSVEYR
jgi:tetratricopeptide (TPR) repeat protein